MIIAYHAIFTTYGTWLPNDPRGSYSKEIYNGQLRILSEIKYGRQNPQPAKQQLMRFWTAAAPGLARASFFLDDHSRSIIAAAFAKVIERLAIKVPACAIMNDHVHILVMPSKYRIEYIVNQLKGAATNALKFEHPNKTPPVIPSEFEESARTVRLAPKGRSDSSSRSQALSKPLNHTPWTKGCWKVFINDTPTLLAAIEYINANPPKAHLTRQSWNFTTPLPV